MMKPKWFDMSFNIGHVMIGLSVIASGAAMVATTSARLTLVETTLASHETEIGGLRSELFSLTPIIAVDQERLDQVEAFNERATATLERIDDRLTTIQVDLSALRSRQSAQVP